MVKVVTLLYLKDKKIYVAPDLTVCFRQVLVLLPNCCTPKPALCHFTD